ncbi:MAG: apolipoprotein N-acyltransferase [Gemmatimonadales bacterium]
MSSASPTTSFEGVTLRLPARDWVLIALAAVLLTLANPPFRLVAPAFVCLVPAALLILRGCTADRPWRLHLHQGFWYGTLTHGALLYWFALALWRYGRAAALLYVVAVAMFAGAYAVMFAVVGRIVRGSPGRLLLALPAGVVFLEWLAAEVGPIAFPWHQLALTVTSAPVLVQTADLAGSGGLAFLLALVNMSIALAWWHRAAPRRALRHAELAAGVVFLLFLYGRYRLDRIPTVVAGDAAVIQPNVIPEDKWRSGRQDAVVERTASLTQVALEERRPALVAWPETALPDAVQLHPAWTGTIARLARASGSTIVAGGVDVPVAAGRAHDYNAAFVFGGEDEHVAARSVYRKRQLIPMVERDLRATPDLTRTAFGGFTPGRTGALTKGPLGPYGILLCYELTFPELAREARSAGAAVLVTLSNDAWFGATSAPYQHFAHAILRAVENRMAVVRAANSGISGVVDPRGRVVVRTEPFVETWATGRIERSEIVPLAVHLAPLVGPGSLVLLLGLLAGSVQANRVRPAPSSSAPSG